jgi:hypothetical protein
MCLDEIYKHFINPVKLTHSHLLLSRDIERRFDISFRKEENYLSALALILAFSFPFAY